jgi:hypothetical protein
MKLKYEGKTRTKIQQQKISLQNDHFTFQTEVSLQELSNVPFKYFQQLDF